MNQLNVMNRRPIISAEEEWNILRIALLRNHLQEQNDNAASETQARQLLYSRHRQEMAQISRLVNPLGWAMAINRYNEQLVELQLFSRFTRNVMKHRQQRERTTMERWIKQQQAQRDETGIFNRLSKLFDWPLDHPQRKVYHQALQTGSTLVLTDLKKSILWASQNFLTMTGYRPIDVMGRTPAFLQGPDTDPATVQFIREQLNRGQGVEADVLNYRRNGESYQCHLRITPLHNSAGQLTHFLAVEYETGPDAKAA